MGNTFQEIIESLLDYDGLFYVPILENYTDKKTAIVLWLKGEDLECH